MSMFTPAVVWPDIETLAVQYLSREFTRLGADIFVSAQKHSTKPYQVIVRDDGGNPLSAFSASQRIGVNCFAPTAAENSELAAYTTAILNDWRDKDVTECTATLAYPVPNDAGEDRYLTAVIQIRGNRLRDNRNRSK
jgi:hypothetical protein